MTTDNVFKIVEKEPKSPQSMVELAYGLLDRLYEEDVNFLEISYRADDSPHTQSVSITR